MKLVFDTVVCGGGPAGFAAALAAARCGVSTLLIEKENFLGGDIFNAGIPSMLSFHSAKGKLLTDGIAGELIENLIRTGGSKGHVIDTVGVAGSVTPVSPGAVSIMMRSMCSDAGVVIMSGYEVIKAKADCFGAVHEILCKKGSKKIAVKSNFWIDASGCGAIVSLAGGKFIEDSKSMPGTLIFNISGVCIDAIKDYMKKNRQEFHFETRFDDIDESSCLGCSGFFSLFRGAKLKLNRDRVLFYQTLSSSEVSVNMTRIPSYMKGNPEAYSIASEQIRAIFRFLRRDVPGFSDSSISYIAPKIGWRENGRVKGLYVLKNSDVSEGRRFNDEVAYGGFPVDIHDDSGSGLVSSGIRGEGFYGIPYKTLISDSCENVLVCGKCMSAEFEAHASARVQVTSMAMGQAAGTAVAICSKRGYLPCDLPYYRLRDALLSAKSIFIE